METNCLSWIVSFLETNRQHIVILFIYFAVNFIVFMERFWRRSPPIKRLKIRFLDYRYENEHRDLRRVMGVSFKILHWYVVVGHLSIQFMTEEYPEILYDTHLGWDRNHKRCSRRNIFQYGSNFANRVSKYSYHGSRDPNRRISPTRFRNNLPQDNRNNCWGVFCHPYHRSLRQLLQRCHPESGRPCLSFPRSRFRVSIWRLF